MVFKRLLALFRRRIPKYKVRVQLADAHLPLSINAVGANLENQLPNINRQSLRHLTHDKNDLKNDFAFITSRHVHVLSLREEELLDLSQFEECQSIITESSVFLGKKSM